MCVVLCSISLLLLLFGTNYVLWQCLYVCRRDGLTLALSLLTSAMPPFSFAFIAFAHPISPCKKVGERELKGGKGSFSCSKEGLLCFAKKGSGSRKKEKKRRRIVVVVMTPIYMSVTTLSGVLEKNCWQKISLSR